MPDPHLQTPRRATWWPYVFAAIMLHGALAVLLVIGRTSVAAPKDPVRQELMVFNLVPPPEGSTSLYMPSANAEYTPPPGRDGMPDADMLPEGGAEAPPMSSEAELSDAEIADILARERDALRAELERLTDVASSVELPQVTLPQPQGTSGGAGGRAPGPEGAVRELDLDGYPQSIVDEIMRRYNLKVVTRHLKGGRRGQSFLSTATRGDVDRYFGGLEVPEGVYEIFQLSRESVTLMSRLEEEALRSEGLEPLKARIIRIVFGIVEEDTGTYVLGVKLLEAEAVSQ